MLKNQITGEVLKTKVATNNIKVAYLWKDLDRLEEAKEPEIVEPLAGTLDRTLSTKQLAPEQTTTMPVNNKETEGVATPIETVDLESPDKNAVVGEKTDDDKYYPAQKLLACKKMGGDTYYKVRWIETDGDRPPDSWSREEDVTQALLDEFNRNFTLGGKRRKRPLTN